MKKLLLYCVMACSLPLAALAQDYIWTDQWVPGHYDEATHRWINGYWKRAWLYERNPNAPAPAPLPIPYNDVSFRLENHTSFIARRISISAERIPWSVSIYTPPRTEMMVPANGGYTTVTTSKNVASTNGLYELTIDFIRPEDRDKSTAFSWTTVIHNQELAKIGTLALFFEADEFRAVVTPKN